MKFILIFLLFPFLVNAMEWESGTTRNNLIELFTSESCSSCPPAEKWMNGMKQNEELFKSLVPVELHVDYWNHLHWKDQFSKQQYTKRQRQYAQKRETGVYTPHILINGSLDSHYRNTYPSANKSKTINLKIILNQKEQTLELSFKNTKELICEAAVLGGGYRTKVKKGENAGKNLRHEFVALNLASKKSQKGKCHFKLEELKDKKVEGISIWVKDPESLEVIQATGARLTPI